VLAYEPAIAIVPAIGNLPDGRRKLLRLEPPHARHGEGEAVNHDPFALPLAREADGKGYAARVLLFRLRPQ